MLSKQLIPLAFGQGLDTRRDPKQQLFGKLRVAENVVFETLDSARKRNGYDAFTLTTFAGINLSSSALSAFKDELLAFASDHLYSYSASLDKVEDRGAVYSVYPTSVPAVNNSFNMSMPDMLLLDGLKVFVYRNESTGAINYTVQDAETQSMLVADVQVTSAGTKPRVQAIGTKVYLMWADGNEINFKTFDIRTPSELSVEKLLINNLDSTNNYFDAHYVANKIVVVYCSTNALAKTYLVFVRDNDAVSVPLQFTGQDSTKGIDVSIDSDENIVITYVGVNGVKITVWSANLTIHRLTYTTVDGAWAANIAACHTIETAPGVYKVLVSEKNSTFYLSTIHAYDVTLAGFVGAGQVWLRSVTLASKSFKIGTKSYLLVSYDSEVQGTYFLTDTDAVVVAKVSTGVAGGVAKNTALPHSATNSYTALVPSLYRAKLVAENGNFYSLNGITCTAFDFNNINQFSTASLGNNLIIGGGVVQAYDGGAAVECGFHVFPEAPILTEVNTGTPNNNATRSVQAGTYSYCAVYRWTDHQGQEHRSAPGEEAEIVVSTNNRAVQIVVPCLHLTQKENVIIELYRTEDAGTLFYLVNDVQVPFLSDSNATVTFLDGLNDTDLISRRLLYTTGGVLENIAPPSAKITAVHTASQRIVLAGLENENEILYSKQTSPGQPVEFNDALRKPVDPVGGPITALASMDEKLIIFAEDAIFFIAGIGPNNLGQQDSFTAPERVSTEVGCIEPKSVVLTPDGLMFKSRKGIYLLGRGLQLFYIGEPVEAFNSLTISSAQVVGEVNQVRFTTVDGDCLVYNFSEKLWATFTNHKALSAVSIKNDYYYLRTDGTVFKENRTSFSDNGSPIKMRVEIGWISFAKLQGFSRVYKMLVLGDWWSAHNLLIRVAYDFKDVWAQQALVNPVTLQIDAASYGEDSPYGQPTDKPYGGYGNPYQFRVNFKQQKCQSIKLLIEDAQEHAGQGFSLSQITFEAGGKQGLFKLSKGKKVAMS